MGADASTGGAQQAALVQVGLRAPMEGGTTRMELDSAFRFDASEGPSRWRHRRATAELAVHAAIGSPSGPAVNSDPSELGRCHAGQGTDLNYKRQWYVE
jgi:hypothetical protein